VPTWPHLRKVLHEYLLILFYPVRFVDLLISVGMFMSCILSRRCFVFVVVVVVRVVRVVVVVVVVAVVVALIIFFFVSLNFYLLQ
jgi:hypothetical protein